MEATPVSARARACVVVCVCEYTMAPVRIVRGMATPQTSETPRGWGQAGTARLAKIPR